MTRRPDQPDDTYDAHDNMFYSLPTTAHDGTLSDGVHMTIVTNTGLHIRLPFTGITANLNRKGPHRPTSSPASAHSTPPHDSLRMGARPP